MGNGTATRIGIEQARGRLGDLADRAYLGDPTILTRHGQDVATVAPLGAVMTTHLSPADLYTYEAGMSVLVPANQAPLDPADIDRLKQVQDSAYLVDTEDPDAPAQWIAKLMRVTAAVYGTRRWDPVLKELWLFKLRTLLRDLTGNRHAEVQMWVGVQQPDGTWQETAQLPRSLPDAMPLFEWGYEDADVRSLEMFDHAPEGAPCRLQLRPADRGFEHLVLAEKQLGV